MQPLMGMALPEGQGGARGGGEGEVRVKEQITPSTRGIIMTWSSSTVSQQQLTFLFPPRA